MAEFLIKYVDATHSDSTKDSRGCYKQGDIVDIKPDGFEWGKQESLPNFIQVKVSGLSVEQALYLIESHKDIDNNTVRRRNYSIAISELPVGVRNQLLTTGRYETTKAAVRNFVKKNSDSTRGIQ